MNKLVIIGASGHAKVCVDIAIKNGYNDIVLLDDNKKVKECMGLPVVGKINEYVNYKECDFFIAIGSPQIKRKIWEKMKNVNFVTLIHPSAVVNSKVNIGRGCVLVAGSVINSDTNIGDGVIVNTCASVGHDCNIGNFTHIAPGTRICGTANVGENCWIGAGTTVINNVDICDGCMVGVGTVVTKSIEKQGVYYGNPARYIRENK